MTECKINEYCEDNKDIILFIDGMNKYLQRTFEINIKQLADCDSHKLISLFIASYLKDLNECSICFKAGLLNSIPLLLKKIIETWRYIIFYHYNEEDARLFYNNDSNYKKPDSTKLNTKVDSCIKDFEIHIYEDKKSLFYKDLLKNIMKNYVHSHTLIYSL